LRRRLTLKPIADVSAGLIYLDIEQLDARATPELLSVLTTRDDRPARFRIYLLNPLLARAAAAHRGCRVADLEGALAEILSDDGAIVTWGARGRRIIQRAGVPADLRERFEARWVNALTDVRRWKRRLYGDWNLPALDGTGHALAMYMTAVGYDVPPSVAPGTTATRLRHLLARLDAASGDHRNPPAAAQRRWHALLEDKSHDCLGLRAVHGRASRELALEAAYRQTTYRVALDDGGCLIHIGRRHRDLDAVMRAARATHWACITAFNPQSTPLSPGENHRRDLALKQRLRARGIRWHSTEAFADRGGWPAEAGVLALGVSRRLAESLGRAFDQAAIVWGRVGGKAELLWCNRLHKVRRRTQ
jgi:hypothetical protein